MYAADRLPQRFQSAGGAQRGAAQRTCRARSVGRQPADADRRADGGEPAHLRGWGDTRSSAFFRGDALACGPLERPCLVPTRFTWMEPCWLLRSAWCFLRPCSPACCRRFLRTGAGIFAGLQESSRSIGGSLSRATLRKTLLTVEIALTVILLVSPLVCCSKAFCICVPPIWVAPPITYSP